MLLDTIFDGFTGNRNMKFRLSLFAAILLIGITSAYSQSPYQFLRYVSSARAAGIAGCFVSMPNDASALFYNPATVYSVDEKKTSFTFLKHVLDINSGNATYVHKLEEGVLAGSVNFTNYGSFEYADSEGNRDGRTFSANDVALGATYSNIIDTNFYWGATLKFVFSNLEEFSSTALALDAGILYRIPEKRTNIGVSILHSGFQLTGINGVSENLPLDIRAGINHRLRGLPLLVNFTFHHLADDEGDFFDRFKNFALGGELYLGNNLRARLGYDNQVRNFASTDSDKGLSGFSGGIGIVIEEFNFDYALAQYGAAASLHRFSIALDI